jgi:hypothetical protein
MVALHQMLLRRRVAACRLREDAAGAGGGGAVRRQLHRRPWPRAAGQGVFWLRVSGLPSCQPLSILLHTTAVTLTTKSALTVGACTQKQQLQSGPSSIPCLCNHICTTSLESTASRGRNRHSTGELGVIVRRGRTGWGRANGRCRETSMAQGDSGC